MSEVRITIGGREYTVACGPGEEDHVSSLGAMINEKLSQLGDSLSPSETQNLLFGALFVADELHETRKNAKADTLILKNQIEELEAKGREADAAVGEREKLNARVSELESELDGLQSAQRQNATEAEELRSEVEQLRATANTVASEKDGLVEQVADLTRERDGLQTKIENKNELLERANDQMRETNQKLESALAAPAPAIAGSLSIDEAELAPSLERFAELLEDCADKLEKQADNT